MPKLTQARLKELLVYDPETGEFHWIKRRKGVVIDGFCGRISIHGYREIGVDYALHRAHRLAYLYMTGEWPALDIDHINRDRSDNRWANLRLATPTENSGNQDLRTNNRTGLKGVYWDKSRNKWHAQIRIDGRKTNLGRFDTAAEAAAAHDKAALRAFGEFAHLNGEHAQYPDTPRIPASAEAGAL